MADTKPISRQPWHRVVLQGAKKAAIGALFFLILMIPRIRRLRKRVWAWSAIRLGAALLGCWLLWSYIHAPAGVRQLVGGLVLLAFGLLFGARPQTKSLEEKAREVGALVVLNGGGFLSAEGGDRLDAVNIFVLPDRLLVLNAQERPVREIPLARVRQVSARPWSLGESQEGKPWKLDLSGDALNVQFRYEGFFAEHLARVAESTLRNLLKIELPVLKI